ncbi:MULTISPECIES: AMP-binding protein [unclassified Streptomyces]|uniref:AMP-binding protein n=1 Tax=unclassified Streptomyces TaxID=2593676 RepID=UPI002156560F|nr:AMP-binding protein [Streptomyces sp. SM10]
MRDLLDGPDLPEMLPARADLLLRSAARRHGDRPALVLGTRTVTYASLDAAVDRCAAVLRDRFGAGGAVIAIGADLHPDVVIAYHGALRSGNTALLVVPLLREQQLQYVLEASGARAALFGAGLHGRLHRIRHGLPALDLVAVLGEDAGEAGPVVPRLAGLLDAAAPGVVPEHPADPQDPAALHFTSGTTGMPKAVVLSHRNVTVNAVQTARAHGLEAGSVTLVHFPSYHPMHMNSALAAGATQVLVPETDPVHAMERARACRAGHIYSLPARLAQLAAHPRLPGLSLPDARMIASGGSALPPAVAEALSRHFGVPVVQGYGLAEASPLTHFDRPGEHRTGSVGRPVEGTEHRVVSLEDGTVLPTGRTGEIQVRGAQVMRGYLDPAHGPAVDADGWLATGDVGRIDEGDRLRLTDRIKDVFKCDNWLVGPSEIEALLAEDPAVADSVVLDRPDPVSGAVAHALLVLTDPASRGDAEEALTRLNARLPYYKQVRSHEVVERIPRTPNGKIPRRELRASFHAQLDGGSPMVILINEFILTAAPEEFEKVFEASSVYMREQPGFVDHTLVRSMTNPNTYINIARWQDAAAHIQVVQSEGFQDHIRQLAGVARATPQLHTVVSHVEH